MKDHSTKYRTNDHERRRLLRRLTRTANPEDLRAELGMARLFLQETLAQNQPGLSNALLTTIAKLADTQTKLKRVNAEYVAKTELRQLIERICDVVTKAVKDRLPDWPDVIDRIADDLVAALDAAKTETPA